MGWMLAKQVNDSWGHLSGNPYKVLNAMSWKAWDTAGDHPRWGWIPAGEYFAGVPYLAQVALGFSPDDSDTPRARQRVKVAITELVEAGAIVRENRPHRGRRATYRLTAVENLSTGEGPQGERGTENVPSWGTENVPQSADRGTESVPEWGTDSVPPRKTPKEGTPSGGNTDRTQSPRSVALPDLGGGAVDKAREVVERLREAGPAPGETRGAWLRRVLAAEAKVRDLDRSCGLRGPVNESVADTDRGTVREKRGTA